MNTGAFELEWTLPTGVSDAASTKVDAPPALPDHTLTSFQTEIFVPAMLSHGRRLVVRGLQSDDRYSYDIEKQTLTVTLGDRTPGRNVRISVSLDPPQAPEFEVNTFSGDFGIWIASFFAIIIAMLFWIIA